MLKILWNIISVIAIAAGIYQGYATLKSPKAELELISSTTSFEMPNEIDLTFDSLSKEDKKILSLNYREVVNNSPLDTITYAGLHNQGDKLASDIRISFPNARMISVRSEGKEVRFIKGETKVEIPKLLPESSIYFVVWGKKGTDGKTSEAISGVYSEGVISTTVLVELSSRWEWIRDHIDAFFLLIGIVILLALLLSIYLDKQTNENQSRDSSGAN